MRSLFCMIFLLSSILTMAQEKYILIGTYTSTGSEGIYVYRFDENTGKATWVSNTKGVQNPSYIAVSKDGNKVYAVNETHGEKTPMVSAFDFDRKTGQLKFINQQPSGGDDPCYVAVTNNGKWVAAGNYSGGNFSVFKVANNGGLKPSSQIIQHEGKSKNEKRQEKAHVHSTVFSPDEKFLFVSDLGTDKIMAYAFNPGSSRPLKPAVPSTNTEAGSGPRHLVFHPNQTKAYLMEELSGTVAVFDYKNGKLELIERVPTHAQDYSGNIGSADIHVSPDGKFLYASNRGDQNSITVFSIDKAGKLAFVQEQPTLGKSPRNFLVYPSGKFVLVANQESDEVVILNRDQQTGLLTDTGNRIKIPKPVCIKIVE